MCIYVYITHAYIYICTLECKGSAASTWPTPPQYSDSPTVPFQVFPGIACRTSPVLEPEGSGHLIADRYDPGSVLAGCCKLVIVLQARQQVVWPIGAEFCVRSLGTHRSPAYGLREPWSSSVKALRHRVKRHRGQRNTRQTITNLWFVSTTRVMLHRGQSNTP